MERTRAGGLDGALAVLAVLAAVGALGACATASGGGGVSLSQSRYSASDLARAVESYDTVYDLLRAHRQVQVRNVGGREVLLVRSRAGGRGMVSGQRLSGGAVLIVDGSRRIDAIISVKQMGLEEIEMLEILRPEQAGEQGYGDESLDTGAIVIDTKRGSGS